MLEDKKELVSSQMISESIQTVRLYHETANYEEAN